MAITHGAHVAPMPHQEAPARPVTLTLRALGLLVGLGAVIAVALLSLRIGSIGVSTRTVWDALFNYQAQSYDQTVIRTLRLPRTIIALGVGGGLAVAGATMQAVTRNPLAGPSILGVSSGASFAIVTAIYYIGITSPLGYIWFAFIGATGASALVFLIGASGRDGASPTKLALAGVVVSALLSAWPAPSSSSMNRPSTSPASGSPGRSRGAASTPSGSSRRSSAAVRSSPSSWGTNSTSSAWATTPPAPSG